MSYRPSRTSFRFAAALGLAFLAPAFAISADEGPKPPVVKPGDEPSKPPADAIVLFDGTNFDQWTHNKEFGVRWELVDGAMRIKPDGYTGLFTKESFGDVQLHIEFMTPLEPKRTGQDRGNSGVYLQGTYEVQVLDSYESETYSDGQCGAIYGQYPPMVNACRPPENWQTYEIVFRAPRFNDKGELTSKARLTVIHNGVLIQDNVEVDGATTAAPNKGATAEGPIFLQDHGSRVMYRNIWLRKLPPIQTPVKK